MSPRNHVDHRHNPWMIGLNSDVAVLFEERGSKRAIYVGRILRIRVKKHGKSWQEYTKDIDLPEMRENVCKNHDKVDIQCYYYKHKGQNKFEYTVVDPATITLDMIVGPVNLSVEQGIFVADEISMTLIRH